MASNSKIQHLLVTVVGFSFIYYHLTVNALDAVVPDGYLLALKVLQRDKDYNHASLFKVEFDGSVSQLWNYSYAQSHRLFAENLFALDTERSLVYVGAMDEFLGLDLQTGEVKIKIPLEGSNLQYFWNYDYIASEHAIYGVCYSHDRTAWMWCRIKVPRDANNISIEYLYDFPTTTPVVAPIDNTYYMDKEHQTIWYYPYSYAVGFNYSTREIIFTSGFAQDLCIGHDHTLNRTFTIINNINAKPTLAELRPEPYTDEPLLELPENLRPNYFGTCSYDQKTHTMIGLMTNVTLSNYTHYYMPTHLLLVDVVQLTSTVVALPEFQAKWKSDDPITAVKFIQNE